MMRVLVADDHLFYREGLRSLLPADEIEIVGEAGDGVQAVLMAERLAPDVVLMDLKMPGLNGIEATRRIVGHDPSCRVLVLTMFEDDSVVSALRAGARGYVLKHATVEDLVRAVTAVHHGELIFGREIAERIVGAIGEHGDRRVRAPVPRAPGVPGTPGIPGVSGLTARENDILRLLAGGAGNAEIARELRLTPKTVRNYVSAILAKLGAANRTEAAVLARAAGLEPPERREFR